MSERKKTLRQAALMVTVAILLAGLAVLIYLLLAAILIRAVVAPLQATMQPETIVEVKYYRYEVIVPFEVEVVQYVEIFEYVPYRYYIMPPMFELLGDDFRLTAYCPCAICCGIWASNRPVVGGREVVATASRDFAVAGVTVAVDPAVIPLGTKIYVEGFGVRVAQDTGGGVRGNHIDIFFNTHAEANFQYLNRRVWKIHEGMEWDY